jgi:hypothetical protein
VTALVQDPRRRLLAFRWVASLLAVFWGFFFFGLIDLFVFLQGATFHEALLLETGWGLLFVFLVAAPPVVAAIRPHPGAVVAGRQIGLVAIAAGLGALWSSSVSHLLVAGGLLLTALLIVVILPYRPRFTASSWAWLRWALVIGAAVPWLGYASASAASARSAEPPQEITLGLDHWPIQSALAIAVVLVSGLAATLPRGSMTPTWTVGIAAAWLGVVAWVNPDLAASMSRPWATAALAWAVAFVIAMHLSNARQSRGRNRPSNFARSP